MVPVNTVPGQAIDGISVIIPARNEWQNLPKTVRSIAYGQSAGALRQIVIADDASDSQAPDEIKALSSEMERLSVDLVLRRSSQRVGIAGARNLGAINATSTILFFTDAHVRFGSSWDELVLSNIAAQRILAATIRDLRSAFAGYGCELVVPFMGTRWVRDFQFEVQVPCSAGTVVVRKTFFDIGCYDTGMMPYGGIEPEFGLRSWLAGAVTVSIPRLEVHHRFKEPGVLNSFVMAHRLSMVHNALRFGLIYLPRTIALQMVRHYAKEYPAETKQAFPLLHRSDLWERRRKLAQSLKFDFNWFVRRFELRDQVGRDLASA